MYLQYSMILNSNNAMICHVWNLLFKFHDIPGIHDESEKGKTRVGGPVNVKISFEVVQTIQQYINIGEKWQGNYQL